MESFTHWYATLVPGANVVGPRKVIDSVSQKANESTWLSLSKTVRVNIPVGIWVIVVCGL